MYRTYNNPKQYSIVVPQIVGPSTHGSGPLLREGSAPACGRRVPSIASRGWPLTAPAAPVEGRAGGAS